MKLLLTSVNSEEKLKKNFPKYCSSIILYPSASKTAIAKAKLLKCIRKSNTGLGAQRNTEVCKPYCKTLRYHESSYLLPKRLLHHIKEPRIQFDISQTKLAQKTIRCFKYIKRLHLMIRDYHAFFDTETRTSEWEKIFRCYLSRNYQISNIKIAFSLSDYFTKFITRLNTIFQKNDTSKTNFTFEYMLGHTGVHFGSSTFNSQHRECNISNLLANISGLTLRWANFEDTSMFLDHSSLLSSLESLSFQESESSKLVKKCLEITSLKYLDVKLISSSFLELLKGIQSLKGLISLTTCLFNTSQFSELDDEFFDQITNLKSLGMLQQFSLEAVNFPKAGKITFYKFCDALLGSLSSNLKQLTLSVRSEDMIDLSQVFEKIKNFERLEKLHFSNNGDAVIDWNRRLYEGNFFISQLRDLTLSGHLNHQVVSKMIVSSNMCNLKKLYIQQIQYPNFQEIGRATRLNSSH